MLSFQQKLMKRLIQLRERCGLSQGKVAEKAGFAQSYLAQIEKGNRPISARALAKMEQVYGKKVSPKLWKGIGRRGRPKHSDDSRLALAMLASPAQMLPLSEVAPPKFAQLHQVRRSSDPLWPMALHLSEAARGEVLLLEKLRAEDEFFWRQFNFLRFDSWSEKRLLVRVGLLGGQLVGVRLDRLGCNLRLVDGSTGRKAGLHRGFLLKGQEASVVWCPQVAVATRVGVFCVDNLLVVSAAGQRTTVAVEVNGSQFHQDLEKQRRRDRALGIPIMHLDAGELHKPGLMTRILRWAHQQTLGTGDRDATLRAG